MPFKAKVQETGEVIDITKYEHPKIEIPNQEMVCPFPDCQKQMMIVSKSSDGRKAHFRHFSESPCNTSWSHNGESPEHIQAKPLVVEYLEKQPEYYGSTFDIEYYGLEIIRRVPDIFVTFKNGRTEAHEIQLSPITIDEYIRRTNDYWKAGINVVWYLGNRAFTNEIGNQLFLKDIPYRKIKIDIDTGWERVK